MRVGKIESTSKVPIATIVGGTGRPKNINRKLKRLSGKEARFRKDVNHCISKQIVKSALDTNRVVAVEDLKGIRSWDYGSQRLSAPGWVAGALVSC